MDRSPSPRYWMRSMWRRTAAAGVVSLMVAAGVIGWSGAAQAATAAPYAVTATIPAGGWAYGVAVDPSTHLAYVTNQEDDSVSVINEATNAVTKPIDVGTYPYGVAVDPTTHKVYVANFDSNSVSVIDPTSNTVTTIEVGAWPWGVAVDPGTHTVYVANSGDNTVSVIDEFATAVTAATTIPVGNFPGGVAVDPVTHTLYVTNTGDNTVSVIDRAGNTPTRIVKVGSWPYAVAVDSATHTAYVTNSIGNTVSVVGSSAATADTITVGEWPDGVAVDSGTHTVYVANSADGTVSVIDGASKTITATVTVGTWPRGLAVDPDTHTVYASNNADGTVSVITPTHGLTCPLASGYQADRHSVDYPGCTSATPGATYTFALNDPTSGWTGSRSVIADGFGHVAAGPIVDSTHTLPFGKSDITVKVTKQVGEPIVTTRFSATVVERGSFASVNPTRLLDTRDGTGAPQAKVAGGDALALQVTGRGGVPSSGVSAVALNVTVTNPTSGGFITAYPNTVRTRPTASNLNFVAGQTVPNAVTVQVGSDGKVALFNGGTGSVDLLADIAGYYVDGISPYLTGTLAVPGTFQPLTPARLLDTRYGTGAPKAKVAGGGTLALDVSGTGVVPSSGVSAVVLNVTVTGTTSVGYITAYPNTGKLPTASNLNYVPGLTVPNQVTVPVSTDGPVGTRGKVALFNSGPGSVDLVADIAGYYLAGTPTAAGTFQAVSPARLLDTRDTTGKSQAQVAGGVLALQVTSQPGVPSSGVSAVVLNVTVTDTTSVGFITAYPNTDTTQRPTASNLNFVAGQTVPNAVTVPVGTDGKVALFNGGSGSLNLLADIAGYFLAGPA